MATERGARPVLRRAAAALWVAGALVTAAGLGGLLWAHWRQPALERALWWPSPRPELPWAGLRDTDGTPFDPAALHGRFTLLFFGYTRCPDLCPQTLWALRGLAASRDSEALQVLFVSVDADPAEPGRLDDYLAWFDPRFRGAWGPPEAVDALIAALGERPVRRGGRPVHPAAVYLIGPDLEPWAVLPPPLDPAAAARDLERLLAAGRPALTAR